jgi:hypothetical protein
MGLTVHYQLSALKLDAAGAAYCWPADLSDDQILEKLLGLRSFIKRIGIRGPVAEIEYTCPIGLSRSRRSEVLPIGRNGDPNGNRTRAAAVKGRCPNR